MHSRLHEVIATPKRPLSAALRQFAGRIPALRAWPLLRGSYRCLLLLLFLITAPALAGQVSEDPLERQMLDIAKDLRCAVCQNQPVSESNADLARDMRDLIREQLRQGKSREEIMQYFVDRYGDYVLMNPPTRGPGFLLWVLPLAVFAVLGVTAFVYLRHRRRDTLPPPPPLSAADHALVEKARAESERT